MMKCLMGYCFMIYSSGCIAVLCHFRIAFILKIRKLQTNPQPFHFFFNFFFFLSGESFGKLRLVSEVREKNPNTQTNTKPKNKQKNLNHLGSDLLKIETRKSKQIQNFSVSFQTIIHILKISFLHY